MEWFLSTTCRNAQKILQLQLQIQKSPFLQNIKFLGGKMYFRTTTSGETRRLKTLHKQLGFLKNRALDERKELDAKISKLQSRIERIREELRKSGARQAQKKKPVRK
ncbi:hypothetical protein ACLKA7_014194 [Drosophila subpalustris]